MVYRCGGERARTSSFKLAKEERIDKHNDDEVWEDRACQSTTVERCGYDVWKRRTNERSVNKQKSQN